MSRHGTRRWPCWVGFWLFLLGGLGTGLAADPAGSLQQAGAAELRDSAARARFRLTPATGPATVILVNLKPTAP